MKGFTASDIPDLTGQTAIVTGASSGIGLETAKALTAHGARVILAVRDEAKGRNAAAVMPGPGTTEVRLVNLASLASVRAFAGNWPQEPIDLLVNNAGVMIPPLTRTEDGFELQFGTNYLGHFALTNLLLPRIAENGRVITISSVAHQYASIDFDDLNWEHRKYRPWKAYAQSKLANMLFAAELQRRLTEADAKILSMAAHPGYAATNIQSNGGRLTRFVIEKVTDHLVAQDAASGALPTLYAATQNLPGNTYAGPKNGLRGTPVPCSRSKAASDEQAARRLWQVSETLTAVTFPQI